MFDLGLFFQFAVFLRCLGDLEIIKSSTGSGRFGCSVTLSIGAADGPVVFVI